MKTLDRFRLWRHRIMRRLACWLIGHGPNCSPYVREYECPRCGMVKRVEPESSEGGPDAP